MTTSSIPAGRRRGELPSPGRQLARRPAAPATWTSPTTSAGWMTRQPGRHRLPQLTLRTYVVAIGDPENTYGEMTTLQADGRAAAAASTWWRTTTPTWSRTSRTSSSPSSTRATSFSAAASPRCRPAGTPRPSSRASRRTAAAHGRARSRASSLFNEFSAGCTSADDGKMTSANPNGEQRAATTSTCPTRTRRFVGETPTATSSCWTQQALGRRLAGEGGRLRRGQIPAAPFWEAGQVLTARENDWLIAGELLASSGPSTPWPPTRAAATTRR